ncbi:membrane protein insertase YidC [Candidatus Kaiserbacteria bacterium]|nr:membrane protein insertase YidC [Candidatus Kaiserbacteria bacterium]
MISSTFHAVVYNPLYNGLIFLVDHIPSHDVGIAIVLLTILVRLVVYPLSKRAIQSQIAMKKAVPAVEELKKKYKKNSPEQTQAVFAFYKEHDIHPFAGLGLMLVQLPILIALYWIFAMGGLPHLNEAVLYSFVPRPETVNMMFLGVIDVGAKHNIVLAILTVATQMIYSRLSMGPRAGKTAVEESLSNDMAKSFDLQVRYMLPLVIGFVVYVVAAAAPLYYVTSNLFMIAQEYLAGRRFYDKKAQ